MGGLPDLRSDRIAGFLHCILDTFLCFLLRRGSGVFAEFVVFLFLYLVWDGYFYIGGLGWNAFFYKGDGRWVGFPLWDGDFKGRKFYIVVGSRISDELF